MHGNSHSNMIMLMEIKKKKRILLEHEASDWLQIWTAAPSLDVKGNRAIKKNFVLLANRLVFANTVTNIEVVRKERMEERKGKSKGKNTEKRKEKRGTNSNK